MRHAEIIKTVSITPNDDPGSSVIGPEREDVYLTGINCTADEFLDWFLVTPKGQHFCRIEDRMTDIGGSRLHLAPGTILSVSFEAYLQGLIDLNAASIKHRLNYLRLVALGQVVA